MRVRVLGSAAGGGIPQWNCACAGCGAARRSGTDRTQDSVAVSGDGEAWYLLNASPDVRTQLLAAPELVPGPGRRETPLRGVLLTTAELDHTLGLLSLREATALTLHASGTVLAALGGAFPVTEILGRYCDVHARTLSTQDTLELAGGLHVRAATVGHKPPRYAAGQGPDAGADWVSALRITDPHTGGVMVYATCLPAWTPAFDAFVAGAALALLDGTFGTDDELGREAGVGRTAREMGHLPMDASAAAAARHPGTRFVFGHLNNSNPAARRSGPGIAADGHTVRL